MITNVLSLLWIPILLQSLGKPLYGLMISYQSFASLGGLGELGMGGAVGLKVGRELAVGNAAGLREFLSTARLAFIGLAILVFILIASLSGLLPRWLAFEGTPGSGSMQLLFLVAAPATFLLILTSYVANLNYACANLVWDPLPSVIIAQLALALQVILAVQHFPLWVVVIPPLLATAATLAFTWYQVRLSHPGLAVWRPLKWNNRAAAELFSQSFWVYLWVLGDTVFITTDRLVVNGFFGSQTVPSYQLNYKLPELFLFVIGTLGFVSGPKLSLWLGSDQPEQRRRGCNEGLALVRLQGFLGIAASLFYLVTNRWFITVWLGPEMLVPRVLELAFAATLAIAASTSAAMQISSRTSRAGIRFVGLAVGVCAAINLILSLVAGHLHSLLGVALATIASRLVLCCLSIIYCSRQLSVPSSPWLARSLGLPLGAIGLFTAVSSLSDSIYLSVAAACLVSASAAWFLGITPSYVGKEIKYMLGTFVRRA